MLLCTICCSQQCKTLQNVRGALFLFFFLFFPVPKRVGKAGERAESRFLLVTIPHVRDGNSFDVAREPAGTQSWVERSLMLGWWRRKRCASVVKTNTLWMTPLWLQRIQTAGLTVKSHNSCISRSVLLHYRISCWCFFFFFNVLTMHLKMKPKGNY